MPAVADFVRPVYVVAELILKAIKTEFQRTFCFALPAKD